MSRNERRYDDVSSCANCQELPASSMSIIMVDSIDDIDRMDACMMDDG
jgi:hypothetical protein